MIATSQTPMERSLKHIALARTLNELVNDLISQAQDMAYHVAAFHQVHEWKPPKGHGVVFDDVMMDPPEAQGDGVSFTLGRQAIQYEIQSLDGVSIERLAQGVAHAFLRRRRQMVAETSYCVERAVCCESLTDSLYEAQWAILQSSAHDGTCHRVSTPQHHARWQTALRAEQAASARQVVAATGDARGNGLLGSFMGADLWTDRGVDEAFVCAPGAFLIANETAWHVLQELQYQRNHSFTTQETARRIVFLRESRPRDVVWCSVEDDPLRGGLSLLVEAKMGCAIAEPDKIVRIDAP